MPNLKSESPLTLEDVLLLWGYVIHYKDEDVCSLVNPKDKTSRPICINQKVGPNGLSLEIMRHILLDAKLDLEHYFPLLAKVLSRQSV